MDELAWLLMAYLLRMNLQAAEHESIVSLLCTTLTAEYTGLGVVAESTVKSRTLVQMGRPSKCGW